MESRLIPKLPLRRVRAATWPPRNRPGHRMPTRCQWSRAACEPGWPLESGGPGNGLSFVRLVAQIGLVFPQLPFVPPRKVIPSCSLGLFSIVKLQVNCKSKGAGCLVTSACGSKGVKPRTRQTRRRLKLVSCPVHVLGVLVSEATALGVRGGGRLHLARLGFGERGDGRPWSMLPYKSHTCQHNQRLFSLEGPLGTPSAKD